MGATEALPDQETKGTPEFEQVKKQQHILDLKQTLPVAMLKWWVSKKAHNILLHTQLIKLLRIEFRWDQQILMMHHDKFPLIQIITTMEFMGSRQSDYKKKVC